MKVVAITQRVAEFGAHRERRDCLDQAWPRFLAACGLRSLAIPNVLDVALDWCRGDIAGLILTGGNDLAALGGDAPERDAVELATLELVLGRGLPVVGVCRGMQVLQHRAGVPLQRVSGHVTGHQRILVEGEPTDVNSYHHFGARETRPPLDVWAVAEDGVIKAVRADMQPITGIMWHPERNTPFAPSDIALFSRLFGVH